MISLRLLGLVALSATLALPRPAFAFEMVPQFGHRGAVSAVAFNGDGTVLASATHDGTVKLWEVATGRVLKTLFFDNAANELRVSLDGSLFQVVIEKTKGWPTFAFAGGRRVSDEEASRSQFERMIRASSREKGKRSLDVISSEKGDKSFITITHQDQPEGEFDAKIKIDSYAMPQDTLGFSQDEEHALVCWDKIVRLYEVPEGKAAGSITLGAGDKCNAFAFSRDGKVAVTGGSRINIFSVPGLRLLKVLSGVNPGANWPLAFDRTGSTLVAGHREARYDLRSLSLKSGSGAHPGAATDDLPELPDLS